MVFSMDLLWMLFIGVSILISIIPILIAYSFFKGDKLPPSNPSAFLQSSDVDENDNPVILFAGDSLTHGNIGIGYLNLLCEEQQLSGYRYINAGINGDFCWNLLQRMDAIIACQPDVIFVLIGTNDAMADIPIANIRIAQKRKSLPRKPSVDWFKENLNKVLDRLASETSARVILLSIPPIGEDVGSEANEVAKTYSRIIHDLAIERGLECLPIYERMIEYLQEHPSSPTYPVRSAMNQMILAMVRHFAFGRDWDAIANAAGQALHIDHIHLNSAGAQIIARIVSLYLSEHPLG
ncbi:MAG: SGNH/GDSL hydrolase family protein [Candidatus Thorarchaeota archaeon]